MSESRGCPSFKASDVEGVVAYPEPLATQKMGCHRLSRRVNKMGFKIDFYKSLIDEIYEFAHHLYNELNVKNKKSLSHFVYDHLGS